MNKQQRHPFSFFFPLLLCCLVFLGGCVRYDVGVTFEGANRGAIAQTIKLSDKLTSFSRSEANEWLKSIEQRGQKLGGKTKHLGDQELLVTIPFASAEDLETKFNAFFNPEANENQGTQLDFVQLKSQVNLQGSNLLFFQRNYLDLDVDLRALGVLTNQGKVIVDPGSLLDIEFRLLTPWGAKQVSHSDDLLLPEVSQQGHQLVWHLQPGKVNKIEAVFWLPNSLGFGTIAIALFILIGFYLKYKTFPWNYESIE